MPFLTLTFFPSWTLCISFLAVIKYHKLGGFNNINLSSQVSIAYEFEIKVSAWLGPSENFEG